MSFIDTRESGTAVDTAIACLMLEDAAVSMGGGGITMEVSDTLSIPGSHKETYPNAVRIKPALAEVADPRDVVASVEDGFLAFESGG